MTVLSSRLTRLTPVLTAKERAILALRAHNTGVDLDPDVRGKMPREQVREYNRYAGLAYIACSELGALCLVIASHVDCLDNQCRQFEMLEEAGGIIAKELGEEVDKRRVRGWRKKASVTVPHFLAGVAEDLRREVHQGLALRWQEIRAVEVVWDEIALEFDGEDAAASELRAKAEEVKTALLDLNRRISGTRARPLPEADDAAMTRMRELVDQAFKVLGLLEDPP
ncbi:MAG TPA: hypothetical protein VJB57_19795 [Dehalococcoidia bacterium]|nr:hypothetical protein [Dehalococcoidia bacterium]